MRTSARGLFIAALLLITDAATAAPKPAAKFMVNADVCPKPSAGPFAPDVDAKQRDQSEQAIRDRLAKLIARIARQEPCLRPYDGR